MKEIVFIKQVRVPNCRLSEINRKMNPNKLIHSFKIQLARKSKTKNNKP